MVGHSYILYGNYSMYMIHSTTVSPWINMKCTVSFYLVNDVNDNEDLASVACNDEMRKISEKELWEGEEIEILYLERE